MNHIRMWGCRDMGGTSKHPKCSLDKYGSGSQSIGNRSANMSGHLPPRSANRRPLHRRVGYCFTQISLKSIPDPDPRFRLDRHWRLAELTGLRIAGWPRKWPNGRETAAPCHASSKRSSPSNEYGDGSTRVRALTSGFATTARNRPVPEQDGIQDFHWSKVDWHLGPIEMCRKSENLRSRHSAL